MKSLELVNELIKEENSKEEKVVYSFERVIDEDYLQQIKQDLEVLEIIRKKEINIKRLRIAIINTKDAEDTLLFYNCGVEEFRRLTLEELLKLKQWLEENEQYVIE